MSLYYKCDVLSADSSQDTGYESKTLYGHNALAMVSTLIRHFTTKLNIVGMRPVSEVFYILTGRPFKIDMEELLTDAMVEAMYEAEEA